MEKKKTIWDYFEDNIEYPRDVAHNTLPYGTVWSYISSTFLNGLINYVKPIKWFLIDRYTPDNEDISGKKIQYRNKEEHDWLKFEGTKRELKDLVLSNKIETCHTDLSCFGDDIVLLAEIGTSELEDGIGRYMFFWFDCDVSDCCIGKFETEDTKEEVIQSVIDFLEEDKKENEGRQIEENIDNGVINYTELPISFLLGWLKF